MNKNLGKSFCLEVIRIKRLGFFFFFNINTVKRIRRWSLGGRLFKYDCTLFWKIVTNKVLSKLFKVLNLEYLQWDYLAMVIMTSSGLPGFIL